MMLQINRALKQTVLPKLKPGNVLLLLGAPGVGKTVLMQQIFEDFDGKSLCIKADEAAVRQVLEKKMPKLYQRFFGGIKLLAIDEAQSIPDIETVVRLIREQLKDICILLTASSSLNLPAKFGSLMDLIGAPLVLFPLSLREFSEAKGPLNATSLEERLLLGNYPGQFQFQLADERVDYLKTFVDTYLLKELLEIDGFRGSSRMGYILQLLALQIGHEMSSYELGKNLGMSRNTAEKYLDSLSEAFIIFKVPSFNRNHPRELSKTNRWYFYDNGVRNAIIDNFNPFSFRIDRGQLWENYCIAERFKKQQSEHSPARLYFWKTYERQQICLVEETEEALTAYDIQWEGADVVAPRQWTETYPDARFRNIRKDAYPDWLL